MADKPKVWYDIGRDFLEAQCREAPGYMRETDRDPVMERVNGAGQIIGFSLLGVSRFTQSARLETTLHTE